MSTILQRLVEAVDAEQLARARKAEAYKVFTGGGITRAAMGKATTDAVSARLRLATVLEQARTSLREPAGQVRTVRLNG